MKKAALILIICLLTVPGVTYAQEPANEHFLIKVNIQNPEERGILFSLKPDFVSARMDSFAELIVDYDGLLNIQTYGLEAQIIRSLSSTPIDDEYHRYQQVLDLLDSYNKQYPDITFLDTIGTSQRLGFYIPAIKISDNADIEEDEPAILYDGLHHAREPVGMECTLTILEYLLSNYGKDPDVTYWIDNTEIWIVPMINPEGWYYMVENELGSPWWRKNLRENDDNGVINTDKDGVDINRNYDFNWHLGGSGDPGSWTYRGPEVFSESEARAKRDLALDQKFIVSLSYHSHGQIVIYSWRENPRAPDQDLIIDIAENIADRIPKFGENGSYDPRVSDCQNGFSRCWMYTGAGTIEYTVETAPSFMPSGVDGLSIAQDNLQGALYVLHRIRGPGITGHITDKLSGKPLDAEYKIVEIYDDILQIRSSDSLYGRYDRLLLPGTYTLEVSKEGYLPETIENVQVGDKDMTVLDVSLVPILSGIEDIEAYPYNANIRLSQNYPNPFNSITSIKYYNEEADQIKIEVLNLMGQKVRTLIDSRHQPGEHLISWDGLNDAGNNLASGLYIYRIISSENILTRNIIKR